VNHGDYRECPNGGGRRRGGQYDEIPVTATTKSHLERLTIMLRDLLSRHLWRLTLVLGLVSLASAPMAAHAASHATPTAPAFSIRGIGPPFFGDAYQPSGVNDAGTVAGTNTSGATPQGFFFAKGKAHSVSPPTNMAGVSINGLNDAGSVAAEACFTSSCGTYRAYVGTIGGSSIAWKLLPPPSGSSLCSIHGCDSLAHGIAAGGIIAGQYGGQATTWILNAKGTYVASRLPYTSSTFTASTGLAVDRFGDVAGVEQSTFSTVGAFWPRHGTPILLPDCQNVLVEGGARFSNPSEVMAIGMSTKRTVTVVGQCLVKAAGSPMGFAPCLWTVTVKGSVTHLSGPVRLDATDGSDGGGAAGMNTASWIVGNQGDATTSATLWIQRDPFLLSSLIPASSGWELHAVLAVNKSGQIAGVGTNAGGTQAFLLTPK
jgi:hypothetical protein